MKIRSLFLNIFVLICSLLVALGTLEVYFRIFNPQPIRPSTYEIDPLYGLKMIPGLRGYIRTDEYIQQFQLNSLGFRDKEHQTEKPKDIYRIIVLGDSFSWGVGVNESDTFTRRLEESLNRSSEDMHYEVFNWGVSAWGTAQEMLCLKNQALRYNPNLVIVQFFKGNDIEDNIYSSTLRLNEEGKLVYSDYSRQKIIGVKRITEHIPFYRFLTQHSHLMNFIRVRLIAKVEISDTENVNTILSQDTLDYGLRLTEAILEECFSVASQNKIKIMVMVIPSKYELYSVYGPLTPAEEQWYLGIDVMLEDVCRRHNVPLLDLSDKFRQENPFTAYYRLDSHFTSYSHRITAEAMESYLRMNNLLD